MFKSGFLTFVAASVMAIMICSTVLGQGDAPKRKKIIFLSGRPSHGYGAHEHYAGCVLLAKKLESAMPELEVDVYKHEWPEDDSALEEAACIVMYADGGAGHPALPHLEKLQQLQAKGVGIVCLHYAVEVPKGTEGDAFLGLLGGYFETDWSVNPHWVARFETLPDHPIARGVEPFAIRDEWYYHMRFRPEMKGVTPILSALPGAETLVRPDGPHSGNPHVRESVAKGELQHVAWAAETENGARSFGFTGGHDHWNWGNENFRRIVLNGIAWAAKCEVPEKGVDRIDVVFNDLLENQDYPRPESFDETPARERSTNALTDSAGSQEK
ncbi:MAG: ThuA domain-containing protein [Pirellulaceae bacterium]